MKIQIPQQVAEILKRFRRNGREAYVVGGCVRDSLLGRWPNDWDVAASALPEETERIFSDCCVVKTGIRHGTVEVIFDGLPVEVTTFRLDGSYSDGRHPDKVTFTGSLKEDLARRDFTVNAMAYNEEEGLVDCFHGKEDLARKIIRSVGDPDTRFHEDGLRILRALRFSSELGFIIEAGTAESIVRNRALLGRIAEERIREEFTKLLCGKDAANVLRRFRDVIAEFLPEIRPAFGFQQHNPHHIYDVWEHTLHALDAVAPEPKLRLSMLLHDLGKPQCFTLDAKGVGHFYGHPEKSAALAARILSRLRYDRKTAETVELLVRWHDLPILPEERSLRRRLNRLGEENLRRLIQVEFADAQGKADPENDYTASLQKVPEMLDRILQQKQCFTLKDLAVHGGDLLEYGVPKGPAIGQMLQQLLDAVIDGKCPNEKTQLLRYAKLLKGGENG